MVRAESPRVASDPHVDQLIAQMTLAEKLGHLNQMGGGISATDNPGAKAARMSELAEQIRAGAIGTFIGAHGAEHTNALQRIAVEESRLKIPVVFANDVIHGYRTIFPIPLAEAATWSPEWIEKACHVAAIEARAAGTHWTYAPMIDVCRDPRWGRIAETAGEDAFLGAEIAAARVRGFQGDDPSKADRMIACAKHYVAYGGAEGGRDYNTVDISLSTLHDVHLPTFKAAVDAGVGSMMSAFNEIGGVPASGNEYTLRTVLRERWGFDGVVISDWASVRELVPHGFAVDEAEAAAIGIRCGVDIDMASGIYQKFLAAAVERGELPMRLIDESVRRTLILRKKLGLFANPYTDVSRETALQGAAEHRALARDVARRSMVLLKNESGVLPLARKAQRIALIGPLVESKRDMLGTWAGVGREEEAIDVLQGLKSVAGADVTIDRALGCEVLAALPNGIDEAKRVAQNADVVLLVLGEMEMMSGEGHSRASVELPQPQLDLANAIFDLKKPTAVILLTGRPLAIPTLAERAGAIVLAWHPGSEAGHAIADVLFGDFNPGGKLPATFPRSTGQVPLYYNHKNTGRPPSEGNRFTSKYIDIPWTPLYPFGFGLSYTSFSISDATVSPLEARADGVIRVSAKVTNTGKRDGDEVVQVYYQDPAATMTRPVRQLCAFRRVSVAAGRSETVSFEIPVTRFGFHDNSGQFRVEPGEIRLGVGGDSATELGLRVQLVKS